MKALVTTDGSDFSQKALAMLGTLLPAEKTEVQLVSVFRSPRMLTYGTDPYNLTFERMVDQLRDKAESDCDAGRQILAAQGFPVKTLTVMGEPASAILDLAEAEKPDVVVVGSHGKSGIQRFLLGSVSEQVVRYSPCSTLVIKPPRDASETV
jgi:nucleotide-binding universal stress UspA family protein